jgi:hypothetical protein
VKTCTDKVQHKTQAEADAAIRRMKRDYRRQGGGHGLRRLNAYYCPQHQCWHTGRSSRMGVKLITVKETQPPTMAELKARIRKVERLLDSERRRAAYIIGKVVEKDRARWREEADRAQIDAERAKDYADTLAIAVRLYGK